MTRYDRFTVEGIKTVWMFVGEEAGGVEEVGLIDSLNKLHTSGLARFRASNVAPAAT